MTACNRSAYFYSLLPYIFSRSPHLIFIKKKKVKPFSLSPYFFPLYYSGKDMARQTRSSSGDSAPSFIHQIFSRIRRRKYAPLTAHICRPLKPPASSRKGRCSGHLIGKSDQTWFPTNGYASTLFLLPWGYSLHFLISSPSSSIPQKSALVKQCQCYGESCSCLIKSRTTIFLTFPFMTSP